MDPSAPRDLPPAALPEPLDLEQKVSASAGASSLPKPDFFRRQMLKVLFFLGLGLIVLRTFLYQPAEIEIVLDYAAAQRDLYGVQVTYLKEEEVVRQVRFDYSVSGASSAQRHNVQLLKGDYQLELDLVFHQRVPQGIGGTSILRADHRPAVRLIRPLLVRGDERVIVHLMKGDEP
jgi:hypothetical protein